MTQHARKHPATPHRRRPRDLEQQIRASRPANARTGARPAPARSRLTPGGALALTAVAAAAVVAALFAGQTDEPATADSPAAPATSAPAGRTLDLELPCCDQPAEEIDGRSLMEEEFGTTPAPAPAGSAPAAAPTVSRTTTSPARPAAPAPTVDDDVVAAAERAQVAEARPEDHPGFRQDEESYGEPVTRPEDHPGFREDEESYGEPTCAHGEEYDPTIPACVAVQLPEERIGRDLG